MISSKRFYKKLSILGVKYAPSIIALSCCLKLDRLFYVSNVCGLKGE